MIKLKYANQLTDEELTEIYKSSMCNEDKFVDLKITRYPQFISLEGHIRIPEEDKEYADEEGYCLIDEDYAIDDYTAEAFYHGDNMSKRLREFLYKKFGIKYAEEYLLGY